MESQLDVQVVCAEAPVPLVVVDWGIYPLTPCCHATAKRRMGDTVCRSCCHEVDALFGMSWLPHDEQGWAIYKQLLLIVDDVGGDPLGGDPLGKAGQIVASARRTVDAVTVGPVAARHVVPA